MSKTSVAICSYIPSSYTHLLETLSAPTSHTTAFCPHTFFYFRAKKKLSLQHFPYFQIQFECDRCHINTSITSWVVCCSRVPCLLKRTYCVLWCRTKKGFSPKNIYIRRHLHRVWVYMQSRFLFARKFGSK